MNPALHADGPGAIFARVIADLKPLSSFLSDTVLHSDKLKAYE